MGGRQFIELFYGGAFNPKNPEPSAYNHLCLISDDIYAVAKQIADAGYPVDRTPQQGPDNNWQMWVVDPDGVRIEIMQISNDSPQGRIIASN
jgi:catechol 2,3-dioxygenase-like lactoylglutathione lyase family enzyme